MTRIDILSKANTMHTDHDGYRADTAPTGWPFAPLRPDQIARRERQERELQRMIRDDIKRRADEARKAWAEALL